MKILFIFKNENFLAPTGLCSIAAVCREKQHKTYLVDTNISNPLQRVGEIEPDIVAYSISTGEAKHYSHINRTIKEAYPEIFSIAGGPHPTFFPSYINAGRFDALCVGEGETAFADLLDCLNRKADVASANIANIVTKENINRFAVRDLERDIDKIPFPDYSIVYDNTELGKYPLKSFITSRGCPYECTYCFNGRWNKLYAGKGNVVRRHSVDYLIENIKRVRERWPLSTVKFYDDIFTYSADSWLEEFAEKYKKDVDLPFFILTRADLLNEDMVRLLKRAGCRTISMSIESGNPEVRSKIFKREISNEQIINAHKLCRENGIKTFTNCIVGVPGTKISDEIESIKLAAKCRADWAEFLIYHPYPGTELGDELIKKGIYKPEYEKMHSSYMHHSPIGIFSKKEQRVFRNLTVMGSICVVFPILIKPITGFIMYMKHMKIFTLAYYLIKMYIIRKKIYVTKTTIGESVRIFFKSFRQECFRHECGDQLKP